VGHRDDFLVVGYNFSDEEALRASLLPYGLDGVEVESVVSTEDSLGEFAETVVARWLRERHPNAIPIQLPTALEPNLVYPKNDWWWAGVEAADDENADIARTLKACLPSDYAGQASTWAALLLQLSDRELTDEDADEYERVMTALTLARWLSGFDAATENNFFSFDYDDAARSGGLDPLRLGFEAGKDHSAELDDAFQGEDWPDEGLLGAALKVCLGARTGALRDLLSDAFGGDASLFWSLHATIWPKLDEPVDEAADALLGLRRQEYSEIERPWRFVTEGWLDDEE